MEKEVFTNRVVSFFFFFNFVVLSYNDFDIEVFVRCAVYDKGPSYAVCNACNLDDLCRIVW